VALPTNISYGTVVGQFLAALQDGSDPDKLPEGVPMKGTVTFVASPVYILDYSANPNPVTILKTPITCTLDSEGYLCAPYASSASPLSRGVPLIATNDPDILPVGWTWNVIYNLTDPQGNRASLPSQSLLVPADMTTDLTTAMNIAASNGAVITKGEQGEPGDVVGVTSESWAGAVTLLSYPQTYLATLTGNITSLVLPSQPYALESGTVTLVLKQDATGSRTVSWPSSVLWPEGLKPQPQPTANSLSVFHLLWTGQNWLGLVGGKNFA
jgi:hypothetical protein